MPKNTGGKDKERHKGRKVKAFLLKLIDATEVGQPLQSDGNLATQAQCSTQTIKNIMADLARAGIVERVKGGKTRVVSRAPVIHATDTTSFS